MKPETLVPLAEVMRPHGVRGEVRLKVFNRESDLLLERDEVIVRLKGGEEHEVSVDRARRADAAILMKLHSIDDRDRADELRGALICVPRADFPEPEDGAFYACDIEGARVVLREVVEGSAEEGEESPVGTVRTLTSYPSVDVLVVKASDGGKDWEIPLVEPFVREVDIAGGVVVLGTLEGLER